METRPPPKSCEYCGTVLRFGYPGNNPENGPAGYYCDRPRCQDAEMAAHYASLTDEEFEEEMRYPGCDDITCDNCGDKMPENDGGSFENVNICPTCWDKAH